MSRAASQKKARASGLFAFEHAQERSRDTAWSLEKIERLSTPEVRALQANAQRLEAGEIGRWCAQVLADRPTGGAAARPARPDGARKLVARSLAFALRGAPLANAFWSRSAITRAGDVVFALWADDAHHGKDGSRCLLWAPNTRGSRPWSDSPGGEERLEHCKRALERGGAEGLLVYGERLEGVLPEEKAAAVDGADAANVLRLKVEKRGAEFWARWGAPA